MRRLTNSLGLYVAKPANILTSKATNSTQGNDLTSQFGATSGLSSIQKNTYATFAYYLPKGGSTLSGHLITLCAARLFHFSLMRSFCAQFKPKE